MYFLLVSERHAIAGELLIIQAPFKGNKLVSVIERLREFIIWNPKSFLVGNHIGLSWVASSIFFLLCIWRNLRAGMSVFLKIFVQQKTELWGPHSTCTFSRQIRVGACLVCHQGLCVTSGSPPIGIYADEPQGFASHPMHTASLYTFRVRLPGAFPALLLNYLPPNILVRWCLYSKLL